MARLLALCLLAGVADADTTVPRRCNSNDSPFYRALAKLPARLKDKRRLSDASPRYWLFSDGEGSDLKTPGVVVDAKTGADLDTAPGDAVALVESPTGELLGFWHLDGQFIARQGGKSWPNPGVWHISIDGNFFYLSGASTLIAGDKLYGAQSHSLGRFFLHAASIRFEQPSTGAAVEVAAPLPPELEGWLVGL
jgi:hypothetical protein